MPIFILADGKSTHRHHLFTHGQVMFMREQMIRMSVFGMGLLFYPNALLQFLRIANADGDEHEKRQGRDFVPDDGAEDRCDESDEIKHEKNKDEGKDERNRGNISQPAFIYKAGKKEEKDDCIFYCTHHDQR